MFVSSFVALTHAETPTGNVFFYSANPAEDADAYPYVGAEVPGYLTGIAVPFNGASVTFNRDSTDPQTGFTPDSATVLNQNAPSDSFLIINQETDSKAVSFFGELGVYDVTRTLAQPDPGIYITPQRVTFLTSNAAVEVMYSLNGLPMQLWDGEPLLIAETSSIAYQGTNLPDVGPLKTVLYTINTRNCADLDGDDIPDRVEKQVGTDPFLSEGDANKNEMTDFDELMRGASSIIPSVIPNLSDMDDDSWLDYDETLRGTAINDASSFPAAPSLETVELIVNGTIAVTSNGIAPPNSPQPGKPEPDNYQVEVLTPGGLPLSNALQTDEAFSIHTSGEQFHLIRARALDGSGRQLLSVVPPKGLCIDTELFCDDSDTLEDWRAGYLAQYEPNILQTLNGHSVDPRSTVEALLLNRYYELASGKSYIPGTENMGPDPELVFTLRAGRNEAELYSAIQASVTDEMLMLVTDYFHFATSPGEVSMMEQLRSVFAGIPVDPLVIPMGVRIENFATIANQTSSFFQNLEDGETVLTGQISVQPTGYVLDVEGTLYRLTALADSFAPNSTITVRAIVDIDDCNFASPIAEVTEIISRTPASVPPSQDSDMDNLDDDWELFNFGDLDEDGNGDPDNDGISNEDEENNNTNPNVSDSPEFAGYQGDADLSTVVNAADLVFVQNYQGADYTCAQCRGIGDADGSRLVELSDLDVVGENLFAQYPDPSCTIIETDCNKSFEPLLWNPSEVESKGVSMPSILIENIPTGLDVNDIFSVNIKIITDGSPIQAASTRINYNSEVLEVLSVTPNTFTFDAYSVVNFGEGQIDMALLSSVDNNGELLLATIQFKAIAEGISAIDLESDPNITGIIQGNGQPLDNLQLLTRGVAVGDFSSDQWILF